MKFLAILLVFFSAFSSQCIINAAELGQERQIITVRTVAWNDIKGMPDVYNMFYISGIIDGYFFYEDTKKPLCDNRPCGLSVQNKHPKEQYEIFKHYIFLHPDKWNATLANVVAEMLNEYK